MPVGHGRSSRGPGRGGVYLWASTPSAPPVPRLRTSSSDPFALGRWPALALAPLLAPAFAPWGRVLADAAVVIPTRIAYTAGLWGTDPSRAVSEGATMVTEKQSALAESAMELALAPWRLWLDLATAAVPPSGAGLDRAVRASGRRVAAPYARRVGANRRRLAGGGVRAGGR